MLLSGVLKYSSVFVSDKRSDRLEKLGFGATLPTLIPDLRSFTNEAPVSGYKASINKELILSDEEAYYLVLHNYLNIFDTNATKLSLDALWKIFSEKSSDFVYKYKCFEFFRQQDYVVRPGLHYGSDYTVYKASPRVCHSELCVTVVPSIPGQTSTCDTEQNWRHLSTLTRVMPDVMKLAMLCYVLPKKWERKSMQSSTETVVESTETGVITNNDKVNAEREEGLVAPDTDLQMFLQFVEALIDESEGRPSPSPSPAPTDPAAPVVLPPICESINPLHRNNSLYLHDIQGGADSHEPLTSTLINSSAVSPVEKGVNCASSFHDAVAASSEPTVSPYLDLLFGGSSGDITSSSSSSTGSRCDIDTSTYHCLEQLTVRPVTVLIRRLHAEATKYQTVGQMQDKYSAKSMKKVPKRLLEGGGVNGSNSGGGGGKNRKRKRRDIGEVRNKSMSKTNQLWKELIVAEDKESNDKVADNV